MAFKLTGTVVLIGNTETFQTKSGTPFTKRDLVITLRKYDQYTGIPTDDSGNTPKFSFMNSNCQQLDGIKTGDIVTVLFDISGRSYTKDGRTEYYTDVRPFKVEIQRIANQQPQMAPQVVSQPNQSTNQPVVKTALQAGPNAPQVASDDDLPF